MTIKPKIADWTRIKHDSNIVRQVGVKELDHHFQLMVFYLRVALIMLYTINDACPHLL